MRQTSEKGEGAPPRAGAFLAAIADAISGALLWIASAVALVIFVPLIVIFDTLVYGETEWLKEIKISRRAAWIGIASVAGIVVLVLALTSGGKQEAVARVQYTPESVEQRIESWGQFKSVECRAPAQDGIECSGVRSSDGVLVEWLAVRDPNGDTHIGFPFR